MVVQIVILMAGAAAFNPTLRTAAMAALNVLRSHGLQAALMNEFCEAMVAASYGSYVKYLDEIAGNERRLEGSNNFYRVWTKISFLKYHDVYVYSYLSEKGQRINVLISVILL